MWTSDSRFNWNLKCGAMLSSILEIISKLQLSEVYCTAGQHNSNPKDFDYGRFLWKGKFSLPLKGFTNSGKLFTEVARIGSFSQISTTGFKEISFKPHVILVHISNFDYLFIQQLAKLFNCCKVIALSFKKI